MGGEGGGLGNFLKAKNLLHKHTSTETALVQQKTQHSSCSVKNQQGKTTGNERREPLNAKSTTVQKCGCTPSAVNLSEDYFRFEDALDLTGFLPPEK